MEDNFLLGVYMHILVIYGRNSWIRQKKHACWKNYGCLMIQKVSFKVQKCKNWPHQFFHTKILASVISPVLAFKILITYFWFMTRTFLPKIAYSGTCWIQWGFPVVVNWDLGADLFCIYIWLIWHILDKCYFFLIQYD